MITRNAAKDKCEMQEPLNIVWLRRDLRLHDHAVLKEALARPGRIQPVFVFDTEILARFSNPQDRRLSFIARQLVALHEALQTRGGGLLVLYGKAQEAIPKLCESLQAARLVTGRDVEPATRARDREVYAALKGTTEMSGVWDHLLVSPEAVLKDDGHPLRVFTPYYQRWKQALSYVECKVEDGGRYADFLAVQKAAHEAGLQVLDSANAEAMLAGAGYRLVEDTLWQPQAAGKHLAEFATHLEAYPKARDMLGQEGTSRLSPYLRFGLISPRECARLYSGHPGSESWLRELAWRDFYAMILYHFPQVVEQEFQERFRGLEWGNRQEWFARWQNGETGYPGVDAGMRQLVQEGWMHNRARMITASFLSKDLLIDWRWGEEHFAQYLMDYDLASNNGGWQWAASVGTDAQPWFRVFNPTLQGKKFDPEGHYIRHYVSELEDVPTQHIHEPWKAAQQHAYPGRMVEHHVMRQKALEMFKLAR